MIRNIAIRNSGLLPNNLGMIDRVSRCLIGLALIGVSLTGFAPSIAAIIAIPVMFMALIAWDPIYAITGINTTASAKARRSNKLNDLNNTLKQRKKAHMDLEQNGNDELLNKVA